MSSRLADEQRRRIETCRESADDKGPLDATCGSIRENSQQLPSRGIPHELTNRRMQCAHPNIIHVQGRIGCVRSLAGSQFFLSRNIQYIEYSNDTGTEVSNYEMGGALVRRLATYYKNLSVIRFEVLLFSPFFLRS